MKTKARFTIFAPLGLLFVLEAGVSTAQEDAPERMERAAQPSVEPAPTSDLIFVRDFEGGDTSGWTRAKCCDYSINVVTSPVRAGDHAVRFELRETDPLVFEGTRSELSSSNALPLHKLGEERWYGFSLFLSGNFTHPNLGILAQWWSHPDTDLGESPRSPPLALRVSGADWLITNGWDTRPVTPDNNPEGWAHLWRGPYRKGVWTDWVVRYRPSYESDGVLQVWLDGVMIVNKNGPNAYNDKRGIYFSSGIYYPGWNNSDGAGVAIVYGDEYRIAGPNGSYDRVAPGR